MEPDQTLAIGPKIAAWSVNVLGGATLQPVWRSSGLELAGWVSGKGMSYLGHEDGHGVVYCLLVECLVSRLCVGGGTAPLIGVLQKVRLSS